MLEDEFQYDGNYKNLVGSVILNKNGQEVLLPQFQQMAEIEDLVPKSINKLLQDGLEERLNILQSQLDEEYEERLGEEHLKSINTSESSYMHQLLIKEQVTALDCYFQNDFYLAFASNPRREDLEKRAIIFAKIFMKHNIKNKQHVSSQMQYQNYSKEMEDVDKQILLQKKNRNPTAIYKNSETREYDNQDMTHLLYERVDDLYNSLVDKIESKIYDYYEAGNLDKCIEWKQCKHDLDNDMDNVPDPEQLLRILDLFKIHYKL